MNPEQEKDGFIFLLQCAALCSWFTAACSFPAVLAKALFELHRPELAVQSLANLLVIFYSLFFIFPNGL